MINKDDSRKIIEISKKYNVGSVYLFGSSVDSEDFEDIDLGVAGIRPDLFFKYYAELLMSLSKSVDLLDLKDDTRLGKFVREKGVRLYVNDAGS